MSLMIVYTGGGDAAAPQDGVNEGVTFQRGVPTAALNETQAARLVGTKYWRRADLSGDELVPPSGGTAEMVTRAEVQAADQPLPDATTVEKIRLAQAAGRKRR